MSNYEFFLQLNSGVLFIVALLWLNQRPSYRFVRTFALISWLEVLWFLLLALQKEEWRLFAFMGVSALKALALPYATRRYRAATASLSVGAGWLLLASVFFGLLSLWVGRSLGSLYHINGDLISVGFFLGLASLFGVATRAESSAQVASLASLQGAFVLIAVNINPKAPLVWAIVSLLVLAALFWRLLIQNDDETLTETR